jgi:predicted N-acetyltransferase YhbS
LDNLCVDFRLQKLGVGSRMMKWGLSNAEERRLSIMTEASPEGAAFYERHGLKKLGDWVVIMPVPSDTIKLVVMCRPNT